MNRDQWHLKMRRENELFSHTGTTTEELIRGSVSGKHADGQQRASGARPAGSKKPEFVMAQAEKYGACCEWDLSIKAEER
jgi:hypothetical protein